MFVTFYINFFALFHLAVGPQFAPKDVKKFRPDHKIVISTQNTLLSQLIELRSLNYFEEYIFDTLQRNKHALKHKVDSS